MMHRSRSKIVQGEQTSSVDLSLVRRPSTLWDLPQSLLYFLLCAQIKNNHKQSKKMLVPSSF